MLTVRSENNQSQKHRNDIRRNENIQKIFPSQVRILSTYINTKRVTVVKMLYVFKYLGTLDKVERKQNQHLTFMNSISCKLPVARSGI